MRVLACVKRVPIPGARVPVADDGRSVDTARLGFTISPHEECAVEEAVRLVERHGGTSTVLTLGPPEAEEQLRHAVSLGIEQAVLVPTDGEDWDPQRTARALADAVAALEDREGTFDLLLFGNESADAGGYQVGVRVATALGRAIVGGVKGVEVDDDVARLTRPTGEASEVYELPLPAAVAVKEGLNLPRYPTMRGRLASRKVAVLTHEPPASDPGAQRLVELVPPAEQVSETVILGHGPDAAPAVVEVLESLEVLT